MRTLPPLERLGGRVTTALLLAAALLVAGCTDSGGPDAPAAGEPSTPPALGARIVPLAEFDGLTQGTPIKARPEGRQVSMLALASDGVALISTRDDVLPKSIDGIYLPAGELKLSFPAGHVERIPGTKRAVEQADLTEHHAVWTERLGPVRDGHVQLSTPDPPAWVLRSYDRTTHTIRTLARIPGGTRKGAAEFSTPLVVGDRAVWSVAGQGEAGAKEVFSRLLDGSAPARSEAKKVAATASDGSRLWYSAVTPGTSGAGASARIVSRDLGAGTEIVAHELAPSPGERLGTQLAASAGTLAWTVERGESEHLVISDGERVLGEISGDLAREKALHAGPRLVGYGSAPDSGGEGGRVWLLHRDRDVVVDLGGSCCPFVWVAGPHLAWYDGTLFRRAKIDS